MSPSILRDRSYQFAVEIVFICKSLIREQKEFVLSKQLLRCGTGIGAMIREAQYAESKADFIHKLLIALKEANETQYFLDLIFETSEFEKERLNAVRGDCKEIIAMLVSATKKLKNGTNDPK